MPISLINRIHQFQNSEFLSKASLFKELERGQHPKFLFIICSDSRLNPHLLTQSEPGELFIIRNAGNIIPPNPVPSGEAATIEYALEVLNIREIVVCGHSHCGAMHGLIKPETTRDLPAVHAWLKHAELAKVDAQERSAHLPFSSQLKAVIEANVLQQIKHLKTHPSVAKRLDELTFHAWVYQFETGKVFASIGESNHFLTLETVQLLQSNETIQQELESIVYAEAMAYLSQLSHPKTSYQYLEFLDLLKRVETHGVYPIWRNIKNRVCERLNVALTPLYLDLNEYSFLEMVDLGLSIYLRNLNVFQSALQESSGYHAFCSQNLRHSRFFSNQVDVSQKESAEDSLLKHGEMGLGI